MLIFLIVLVFLSGEVEPIFDGHWKDPFATVEECQEFAKSDFLQNELKEFAAQNLKDGDKVDITLECVDVQERNTPGADPYHEH